MFLTSIINYGVCVKSSSRRIGFTACSCEVGRRVVLSLSRRLPCVNEIALVQIGLLLWSGRSPEDRVAVREPAEAGNNLKMAAGLADPMLIDRSQALGSFVSDPLRHCNDTLQPFPVARAFRVNERHKEECLLPRPGEGVVVAVPQSLLGDPQGLRIGGVGVGRGCVARIGGTGATT